MFYILLDFCLLYFLICSFIRTLIFKDAVLRSEMFDFTDVVPRVAQVLVPGFLVLHRGCSGFRCRDCQSCTEVARVLGAKIAGLAPRDARVFGCRGCRSYIEGRSGLKVDCK